MIGFIGGTIISFFVFMAFICGTRKKSDCRDAGARAFSGIFVLAQLALFIVGTVFVFH